MSRVEKVTDVHHTDIEKLKKICAELEQKTNVQEEQTADLRADSEANSLNITMNRTLMNDGLDKRKF